MAQEFYLPNIEIPSSYLTGNRICLDHKDASTNGAGKIAVYCETI